MKLLIRKLVALFIVPVFCLNSACYGVDITVTTLAVPSRIASPDFQHIVELEIGVRQALKDVTRIDLESLAALGEKNLQRSSIFRPAIDGAVRFQEVEEVMIEGVTYFAVRADIGGADYVCLVDKAGVISIAPYQVYVQSKASQSISVIRDIIDAHTRDILNRYVEHEISTANNVAVDPWIAEKMRSGSYAIDGVNGKRDIYGHPKRGEYNRTAYDSLIGEIAGFLNASGVKDSAAITRELVTSRPVVLIPYKEGEALPSVTIAGVKVSVTAHSSKFATYIFLPESSYNAAISAKEWPSQLREHIKREIIHEIGAISGLKVALVGGAISNILDAAYDEYRKAGQPSTIRLARLESEILKKMAPIDLLNLELRNDYASGKIIDQKGIFARLIGLALAATGLGCQPSISGVSDTITISKEKPSPSSSSSSASVPASSAISSEQYLNNANSISSSPAFKRIVNNPLLVEILEASSRDGKVGILTYFASRATSDPVTGKTVETSEGVDLETYLSVIADFGEQLRVDNSAVAPTAIPLDQYMDNMQAISTSLAYKRIVNNPALMVILTDPARNSRGEYLLTGLIFRTEYDSVSGKRIVKPVNSSEGMELDAYLTVIANFGDWLVAEKQAPLPDESPRMEEVANNALLISNSSAFKRIVNNPSLMDILMKGTNRDLVYYLALRETVNSTGSLEYVKLETVLNIIADFGDWLEANKPPDFSFIASSVGGIPLWPVSATKGKDDKRNKQSKKKSREIIEEKAAISELDRVVSDIPSPKQVPDRLDVITDVLWNAGTEAVTIDEAKKTLETLAPGIADSAEGRNAIYDTWISVAKEILVSMALSVPGNHRAPDRQAIEAIAVSLRGQEIEIFIPASQMPKDTTGKFKSVIQSVFGDRLRPYGSINDLKAMINDPDQSVVMTIGLGEGDIDTLKDINNAVRIVNFSNVSIEDMTSEEHENYIAETVSILMIARSITESEAKDKASSNYRILAHLLESHMENTSAIDSYINNIADTSIDQAARLQHIIKNILKALPIVVYKVIKPVVSVLWSV